MSKMTINVQDYTELDNLLQTLAEAVDILDYVTPLNNSQEKRKFLSSDSYTPHFEYKELEYDPSEIIEKIKSINIPDDALGQLYTKKRDEALLMVEMMENRGDDAFIQEASSKIYGIPSEKLVEKADKLLLEIKPVESIKDISAEEVKIALEKALKDYNIDDWAVGYSEKKLTNVYPAEKMIKLNKNRKFSKAGVNKLIVHEIGGHIFRGANGYEQELKIFATGLPGYLSIEEGLSLYCESVTGNINPGTMQNYAGRVIAVDSVLKGLNFKECFDKLRDYELTEDDAWNLTVRAYRGGGFIKDHVYLEGYEKVKDFVDSGGDLKRLYVGKVGISDLPLVKELLDEGILKKAKYLPSFLQESV